MAANVVPTAGTLYREEGTSMTLVCVLEVDRSARRALVEHVREGAREWLPFSEWEPLDNPGVLVEFEPRSVDRTGFPHRITTRVLTAPATARRVLRRLLALLTPTRRRADDPCDQTHAILTFESVAPVDRIQLYVAAATLADFLSRRLDGRGFITLRHTSDGLTHVLAIVSTGREFTLRLDRGNDSGLWSLRVGERVSTISALFRPASRPSALSTRLVDEIADVLARSGEYRSIRRIAFSPEE